MKKALSQIFSKEQVKELVEPAKLDGGDVLWTGRGEALIRALFLQPSQM